MITLESIQLIDAVCATVTPEIIARFGRKLTVHSSKEKTVGWVQNDDTKRLYCAAQILKADSRNCDFQATVAGDIDAKELGEKSKRLSHLASFALTLFWIEIMLETKHYGDNICIRQDYMVFEKDDASEPPEIVKKFMRAILGGGIGGLQIQLGEEQAEDDN